MEQHPIPQDVTGFQFKLFGPMTVKQFGYVAAGVISAVVIYYLPLNFPLAFLVKFILIPLFGGTGAIIAFVPIEGRPIDVMAGNFFSALFSPNQYIYHKQGKKFSFNTVTVTPPQPSKQAAQKTQATQKQATKTISKEQQLRALLMSESSHSRNQLDEKEMSFLKSISSLPVNQPRLATAPVSIPQPQPISRPQIITSQPEIKKPVLSDLVNKIPTPPPPPPAPKPEPASAVPTPPPSQGKEMEQKEANLEQQLEQAKKEEAQSSPQLAQAAHQKVLELEKQMQDIHAQKERLEQEVLSLRKQLEAKTIQQQAVAPATPPPPAPAPAEPAQHVRNIPQGMTTKAGLPHVPDTPNVMVGIVKDPRGNILPNILVEVKDKEGNPVRAFKTNPLGQFASATPLPSGTYTIELEDPKQLQKFDVIQIIADNKILPPIEIISHDAREQLRKELFN
jgi:hypothetical protein